MYHIFRLRQGQDLKGEIEGYVREKGIKAGVVLSCVGCIEKLRVRLADGESILEREEAFEIVSMTGTLCLGGVHLHMAASNNDGRTIGGHLKDGCIVSLTTEICLLEIEGYEMGREWDEGTGFEEMVVRPYAFGGG